MTDPIPTAREKELAEEITACAPAAAFTTDEQEEYIAAMLAHYREELGERPRVPLIDERGPRKPGWGQE